MRSTRNPLSRLLVLFLPGLLLLSPAIAQQPPEVNGIAAKVNGRVITKNRVSILLFPEWKRLAARFPDQGPEFEKQVQQARDQVLQELIEREKLLSRHNPAPIKIDPAAIDEEVQREIRDNYEGKQDQFEAALYKNRITMEGFRRLAQDKLLAEAILAREANKK